MVVSSQKDSPTDPCLLYSHSCTVPLHTVQLLCVTTEDNPTCVWYF